MYKAEIKNNRKVIFFTSKVLFSIPAVFNLTLITTAKSGVFVANHYLTSYKNYKTVLHMQ